MSQLRDRRSIKGRKSSVRECLQAFTPLVPPLVSSRFFFLREFFSRTLLSERLEQAMFSVLLVSNHSTDPGGGRKGGGRGGSYFPYILLNEIQTMFSQLAKRSARVLLADLCTNHAHYVKIHRSTVLRRNKNMAVEGETVSHYYVLVIRKFIDFMSLFRQIVRFSLSVKQFPSA